MSSVWAATSLAAERWRVETTVAWHSNVTNGERDEDVLGAVAWRSDLWTSWSRAYRGGRRLDVLGGMQVKAWPRFQGLDHLAPEVAGTWTQKLGLGPRAPVVGASLEGGWHVAREVERSGGNGTGRLLLRQRLGTTWLLHAAHDWNRFDARSLAFAQTARTWTGRIEWNPRDRWWLAFEGSRRVGDVVSYSFPPRPDLEKAGKPLTFVDTFEQPVPLLAYYFEGETRRAAVQILYQGNETGLALRHELGRTLHAGPGYDNQVTSLRFFARF